MTNESDNAAVTLIEIEDRLTKTLIRLRFAKLKQIVERKGQAVGDVLFIKKTPHGWRIGAARPFPLHPRDVAPLTQEIRAVHYRRKDLWDQWDDASEHRLGREVAEYLDTKGQVRSRIQRRAINIYNRQAEVAQNAIVTANGTGQQK